METRIRVKFEEAGNGFIRSVVFVDDKVFTGKQHVGKQADRIDPVKRAKQQAFVKAMYRVIGYMVDKIRTKS